MNPNSDYTPENDTGTAAAPPPAPSTTSQHSKLLPWVLIGIALFVLYRITVSSSKSGFQANLDAILGE